MNELQLSDYAALTDILTRMNWSRGRGTVVSVSLNGWFDRYIPTTQNAGFTERRKYTYRNGRIFALRSSRKLHKQARA